MTSTALVPATRQLTPNIWQQIMAMAPVLHQSRLFGVASENQAAAIMLTAYELGLPFSAGFELIHVVQGKPSLSPRGALALINQSGELETLEIKESPDACTVRMKRKNGPDYAVTYTLEEAKKAGLVKPGSGWANYPANMLRWRAIGFCADVVFPDVLGGLKRADEYGADITPAGDVIDGQWSAVPTPAADHSNGGDANSAPTLEQLIDQYSAEAVIAANEGRIPGTAEELTKVAEVLAHGDSPN